LAIRAQIPVDRLWFFSSHAAKSPAVLKVRVGSGAGALGWGVFFAGGFVGFEDDGPALA